MDAKAFLGNSAKRTLATILGYKDENVDHYLPADVADGLRKVILDEVNRFREVALDVVGDAPGLNEHWLEALDQIQEIYYAVIGDDDEEPETFIFR